ncbi:hypothetical protein H632_c1p3 [Helicosporidium sp. ATCC 50920]|nr:hypothetical protein H632_c1p3 [Helicosporidium sp. ATCC 50920]|eukprot:KDD77192.1 hypothetical protein H632_c1p3 [Helicosporidium sp. ATCC 50920]
MPLKSKKSKSKRVTLRKKYKILKKVREHHRKARKDVKKLGNKIKPRKDPGIPSAWPFKEQVLQDVASQKKRELEREFARRDAALLEKKDAPMDEAGQLAALQEAAEERVNNFVAEKMAELRPEAVVDYSRKAFYKDFVKVVEVSDVIVEVIDARDPEGGRCLDVERFIRRMGSNKKIILLLNKVDLVPREVVEMWLERLREELPTVAFKCNTQQQASGADVLLQLLKNYARNAGLKTTLTVGIVGLPNVGKSSLINSLKRARVAQVGNTPGVTRAVQEVHLDAHIKLLDSPGVVFADPSRDGVAAAALRNCVKVEQLDDPVLPVTEIVKRCPRAQLMQIYSVPRFDSAADFLQLIGGRRGKLKKGGTVDVEAAARIVLQNWSDGLIPYYTMPPERKTVVEGSSAIVQSYAKEFGTDQLFAHEKASVIQALPEMESDKRTFFATPSFGAAFVSSLGDGMEDEGPTNMDESDEVVRLPKPSKKHVSQESVLYNEEGQFNPHAARAQRKKRKSQRKQEMQEDSGSDFDFNE